MANTLELTHVTPGGGCASGSDTSNSISNKSGLVSLTWEVGGREMLIVALPQLDISPILRLPSLFAIEHIV
jgi:hypothetical protein